MKKVAKELKGKKEKERKREKRRKIIVDRKQDQTRLSCCAIGWIDCSNYYR